MPEVECPETWKEYFRAHLRKEKWILGMEAVKRTLPQFLVTYFRLQNPKFGKARQLTTSSCVYLTFTPRGYSCPRYEDMDCLQQRSSQRTQRSLRSGAVAMQLVYPLAPASVLASDVNQLVGDGVCVVLHASPDADTGAAYLSYADVAEALLDMDLLTPLLSSDPLSRVPIGGDVCIETVTPRFIMPFEVYSLRAPPPSVLLNVP